MPHVLRVGAIVFVYLGASYGLLGETPDPRLDDAVKRLDDAVKEIALLKRTAADQDRRIAGLERTVRAQQSAILAATRPIPTIPWKTLEGWAAVKVGMSRAQVVEILGEPQSTESVIDRQTLFYKEATAPVGHVVITDDRVSEVTSNRFRIYITSPK
jgi:SmpA / OmlA family